jgi:hypothetical protein
MYQEAQKIFIDPLYLKPAMPFALQYINSGFHGNIIALISSLPYSELHALLTIVTLPKDLCDVTMVTKQRKQSQTIAEQEAYNSQL